MKRLQLILLSLALLLGICLPLCVKVAASDAGTHRFVIDNAKLLTQNQAEQLERSAEEISRCQHCDVVILTADGIDGRNPTSYADDYFDMTTAKDRIEAEFCCSWNCLRGFEAFPPAVFA